MEKQEKNQLKNFLNKYLDSTSMDSNQLMSASEVLNSLEEDKSGKKLTSQELSKELEEANEFLEYVTHMCANAFGIDEDELEDSDNEDSSEDSVSVFDLDIKEADDIYDNLYDWGLEDADVDIDKDGNVLVFGLFPDDIPHFTEAFNDAFSKDMSKQDITDYLKDAYNRYNSNKPLEDSYDEGYPIEDDLRNGRVFLKGMVVKFPPMGSEEEKEYELFQDFDNFMEPKNYHYSVDGVKYIISKSPEKESFEILDKRFPLYDTEGISHPTTFDEYKQLPFLVSLDKMMVTSGDGEFELNKWEDFNANRQYFSFTNSSKMFIIYRLYDRLYASSEFYLLTTIDLSTLNL